MIKGIRKFIMLSMVCASVLSTSIVVSAGGLEDNLSTSQQTVAPSEPGADLLQSGTIDEEDSLTGDWISNQRGLSSKNLEEASTTLSPLTNIVGNVIGGLIVLAFLGMFLVTAIDLLYIAFPPIRNLLYKGGNQQSGSAVGAPVGGYGGYGGYGGGRFSQMGVGMAGANQGSVMSGLGSIQWVSDEAVQCVSMLNGGMQTQQQAVGSPTVTGAVAQTQSQTPMRSVLGTYFKKRIVFMVLLATCVIVLTSSALLGTGVNLALWMTKIINGINSNIPK